MVDWSNAGSGVGIGAGIGSSFGPIGAGIGGALGGLAGLFGFGKGKKDKIKQTPNYTPDQINFINDLLQQAKAGNQNAFEYLNSILSDEEGVLEDFQRPALDQFNNEIIPGILERFTGLNAGRSSALEQTLGQAAKGLATNLSAQRAGLKQNAINQLQNFGQLGLTRQTSPYIQQGTQGSFGMLAPYAGQGFLNLLNR